MEVEEIYNLTISPLIASRFAIQWSEDDHISVLTERGAHILEFVPSPMSFQSTLKFSKSFIYTPLTLPTESFYTKLKSKIWSLDPEAFHSLLMEESLTPKMPNMKEMVPRIIDLAWSPHGLIDPRKCLIAILTSTGAVTIAFKVSKEWYTAFDLSAIRCRITDQEMNTRSKNNKYSSMLARIRSSLKWLQASSFAWSKLFSDFAYFAVAYRSGDIIIYRIPSVTDYIEIPDPNIVGTVTLNDQVRINVLHWITIDAEEHLIIVGYFDGRIYGLTISVRDQNFELESIEKYYVHADRIPVGAIRTLSEDESNKKILVAKGSFLFLLRLTTHGTLESMQHLQLEGFTISGMICISKDCALVTTENGCMFMVNAEGDQFSTTKLDNKSSQANLRHLGLARSPNSVILINVTVPATTYDHLSVKEPSKMQVFVLKNEEWNPLSLLTRLKNERFKHAWDCLEVLRIRATRVSDPQEVLPKLPSNLKSLTLHELRIAMWTSMMIEICDKKKIIQGIGSIVGEISDAQPLIFLYTACDYLAILERKAFISTEQTLSVSLLKHHLNTYLAKNNDDSQLSNLVRTTLSKLSRFDSSHKETCNLCGITIESPSWKVTMCSQGHLLPRCAITLLQITMMNYKKCPICGLIFHHCLEDVYGETRCLYCDVPALEDNRLIGSRSVPVDKSLSKPRGNNLESIGDQETKAAMDETC
ncbi:uncharacterized protein LOC108622234 [Ceratina calcarata]|uniref:Uncharacterized protein LOC108622234 n=1 Tax=Ceratina calcarata TaxID=156304 RepID=A0AAJ7ISB8_9HYME|nr:uncharacterized protein LOC108622234 [Ceratina calcarata]XP_017875458.1 uncharacterized protein LOC108622234 [Ceratina calcarata]